MEEQILLWTFRDFWECTQRRWIFAYRKESSNNFITGNSPLPEDEPSTDNLDVDYEYFDNKIWPNLANKISCFEALKVRFIMAERGSYIFSKIMETSINKKKCASYRWWYQDGLASMIITVLIRMELLDHIQRIGIWWLQQDLVDMVSVIRKAQWSSLCVPTYVTNLLWMLDFIQVWCILRLWGEELQSTYCTGAIRL